MGGFGVKAPKLAFSFLLTCAVSLASLQWAQAAATVSDITYAIQAAHILEPSTPFNVAVDGDKVRISTYRDSRENEKDRKINAVLIGRAVIQASGDAVSRVTVYFYGKDLSQYQEISVSSGDIKAFASGQTSQDQLLSALTLETKRQDTSADKVAHQLEAGAYARPKYDVALKTNESLLVSTALPDWVPDDEAMVEAVRVASNAAQAAPPGVREIKIAFVDPRGKALTREMTFNAGNVKGMWDRIQADLAGIQIARVQPVMNLQSIQVAAGPLQEQRAKLLSRLTDLEKAGVGVGPFVKAFVDLEQQVNSSDEATLQAGIARLNASLDAQEKAAKAAKESRPIKTASGPDTDPSGGSGSKGPRPKEVGSRWGYGPTPITAEEAAGAPEMVIARKEKELPNAEKNPLFLKTLDRIVTVLTVNGRASEAAPYKQRADRMRMSGVRY